MWDVGRDLGSDSKDVPCNLSAHFQVNYNGQLDMTVFNRSNDIIWGCYGANAVHFSMLQEYMADKIGVQVGQYWQVSNNWHAYVDNPVYKRSRLILNARDYNPYHMGRVAPYPLGADTGRWDEDLKTFFVYWEGQLHKTLPMKQRWATPFFKYVVAPMWVSHAKYKAGDLDAAERFASKIDASDWRMACVEWLRRRRDARGD
jgi:hypothetical protein